MPHFVWLLAPPHITLSSLILLWSASLSIYGKHFPIVFIIIIIYFSLQSTGSVVSICVWKQWNFKQMSAILPFVSIAFNSPFRFFSQTIFLFYLFHSFFSLSFHFIFFFCFPLLFSFSFFLILFFSFFLYCNTFLYPFFTLISLCAYCLTFSALERFFFLS